MGNKLTVGDLKKVLSRHPDDRVIVGTIWNELLQMHILLEAREINCICQDNSILLQVDFEAVGRINIQDQDPSRN